MSGLPNGWIECESRSSGKKYYFNTVTKVSSWEKPLDASTGGEDRVQASHILVKHRESRRPSSWRQETITKSKDEAIEELKKIRESIVDRKATFDKVAKTTSDCSSARKGGDLGVFGRGQMQRPFEEATFALQVGELSDIVDTDSGVHIILRTG
jgi:peptidyl-prolyl cis-trans isomerase NIMA-interacting 1